MSFSLGDINRELARLEDQVTDNFADMRLNVSGSLDNMGSSIGDSNLASNLDNLSDRISRSDAARLFDGSAFEGVLARSGFADFDGNANIRNLNDIATLAEGLPAGLGDPDATGEVPTGSAAIGREQAAIGASLAAAPRIVEALGGANVQSVEVRGETFLVSGIYEDEVSGFSALRLTPVTNGVGGGREVFAIDGLEVGSRADEVAAATLGRLQVESDAFRLMVAEAAAVGILEGRQVEFTGPSLGGAIAQVAAYETAEALVRAQSPLGTGAVQLVTVDPLGGRDAAEAINGGTLDPTALNLIAALNIRTEGDVVSRIGSHIGTTLTLPALDAQGNRVELDAADAHVNVVSLLQNLNSDALFAQGQLGAPAEISGFAAASDAASEAVIQAWLASGERDDGPPGELQIPGTARFDATGTVWTLDADDNGTVDIAVTLRSPVDQATADLVLV
jgi:hypothetical protein